MFTVIEMTTVDSRTLGSQLLYIGLLEMERGRTLPNKYSDY